QLAGRALDTVRIQCIRKLSADKRSREYKILKSHWRLLHKYSANLERQKRRYLYGLNEYMTQAEAINLVFNRFPNLEQIWNIYQQILAAIRTRNALLLVEIFNIKPKNLPDEAVVLIKTLKKNIKGISESCDSPYSNGPLEGLNRKIKQISRSGYGYRNLANFFNRIRLEL
ncbi:transposase, partial [Periweissella ghanensis]